jgi:ABC-type glycerol-3-phosphate transport system substrate-binding protein
MATGQDYKDATGNPPFFVANLEGYVGAWVVAALAGGEGGENTFTDMYSGAAPVDGDPMLKAYQAWAEFGSSGLTNPDAGELTNGESTAGFLKGISPYYIVGMWEDNNMVENFGDQVETFFIPVLDGAKYPVTATGGPSNALSITNYSKHQEEAKDFLRFLAQPELIDMYVSMTQIEASNSRSADPSVIESPLLQIQAQQLTEVPTKVYPFDNVMPQSVIDLFYRLNASVFLGTTTPEDAVAQLQAAYDAAQ